MYVVGVGLVTVYKALIRLAGGALSILLLMSMSVKISLSLFAVIKLCYTKLLSNQAWTLVPKLTLLRESNIVQLSSWGLVWDLQDKVRPLRALSSMLSQDTRFLFYLTNSMVCLCE